MSYEVLDDVATGRNDKLYSVFQQRQLHENQVLLISAAQQTSGIGTNGRVWQSPIGNIYATFIFPWPVESVRLLSYVAQVANLAICETVENFGLTPQLKWVNDMLLDGKKSAGILCKNVGELRCFTLTDSESVISSRRYSSLVVGIGLNVNMDESTAESRFIATTDLMKVPFSSMKIATSTEFNVEDVFSLLQRNLLKNYKILLSEGDFYRSFHAELDRRLAYRGEVVLYQENESSEPIKAVLTGIDENGYAMLNYEDGKNGIVMTGRIRPFN